MIKRLGTTLAWVWAHDGDVRFGASALFLCNFILAKFAIYGIPILIAAFASPEVYGGIEFAQSWGLLITAFIVGAPLNGITQIYLIRGKYAIVDQLAVLMLAFGLATIGVSFAIMILFPLRPTTLLVVASLASACAHNVSSTFFRTLGLRNATAWADGTAMLIAVGIVFLSIVTTGRITVFGLTVGYLGFAILSSLASGVLLLARKTSDLRKRLIQSCKIGFPMVVSGIFAMWLGVGGRITVGQISAENVAVYSVAFRVAGLTLGIHQFATTALFTQIYKAKTRQADRMIGFFLAAVTCLSLLIGLAGPLIIDHFDFVALDGPGSQKLPQILPIVSIQIFFWIGYAMLQSRVNRSGLAKRSILPTAINTVVGAGLIFGLARVWALTIDQICWLVSFHAAAYFFVSWSLLAKRGLPHRVVFIVAIVGGCTLSALALLMKI